MTRIAVFSDLHIPTRRKDFPLAAVEAYMADIDLVFGLGDYVRQSSLDELYAFKQQVYAVAGNMDEPLLQRQLSGRLILNIEEVEIGLIHGFGSAFRIRERIKKEFMPIKPDLICYGHTHTAYWGCEDGTNYFNPGSLSNHAATFGILEIEQKQIEAKIIDITL